jgi:hypothetical protein
MHTEQYEKFISTDDADFVNGLKDDDVIDVPEDSEIPEGYTQLTESDIVKLQRMLKEKKKNDLQKAKETKTKSKNILHKNIAKASKKKNRKK